MRRIVDFSDYQAGLNLDVVASAVDGAWAKAGDWSYIRSHGWPGDDVHLPAINRFQQLGKPIGTYLFVRPGWTSPATQIDQWRQNTPAGTTLKPMIDLEVPGTLSGSSLTDWVTEALHLTADRFEVALPVLYWSASFQSANGMGVPSAPHLPMVAEYHRGYSPFNWADVAGWEQRAYSAYAGPDVPRGYGGLTKLDMIWQFTSSAQIPGFSGLVDCSFCNEAVWQQLISSDSLGAASFTEEEDLTPEQAAQLTHMTEVLNGWDPFLRQTYNQTTWTWGKLQDTDGVLRAFYDDAMKKVDAMAATLAALPLAAGGQGVDPLLFAAQVKQELGNLLLAPRAADPAERQEQEDLSAAKVRMPVTDGTASA